MKLSLVVLLASIQATLSQLDFNTWIQQIGVTPIISPNELDVTFISPQGSSITGNASPQGTFCFHVELPPVFPNGVGLSIRVKSGGPGANNDVTEFEWFSPQVKAGQVTTNIWDVNSLPLIPVGGNIQAVPVINRAQYCITWAIGGFAYWYVNGVVIKKWSMAGFTIPLFPEIVTFGNLNDQAWFVAVAGTFTVPATTVVTFHIYGAYISQVQEAGPFTLAPTSVPTTLTPTAQPSTSAPSIEPTIAPSAPSVRPSLAPSPLPTIKPTRGPSFPPNIRPSVKPTQFPFLGVAVKTLQPTLQGSGIGGVAQSSTSSSGSSTAGYYILGISIGIIIIFVIAGLVFLYFKYTTGAEKDVDYESVDTSVTRSQVPKPAPPSPNVRRRSVKLGELENGSQLA